MRSLVIAVSLHAMTSAGRPPKFDHVACVELHGATVECKPIAHVIRRDL
jgi:hypothetical protein